MKRQIPESNIESQKPISKTNSNSKLSINSANNHMKKKSSLNIQTTVLAVAIVLAGIGTGYGLNQLTIKNNSKASQSTASQHNGKTAIEVNKVYGSTNDSAFPDKARGVLVSGGIEGEGTHSLLRPGGASQTICLTSSVMDLSMFEGHEVEVWGATFDTQKCSWFMDVGRVKPIKLNVETPFEVEE